MKSVVLYGKVLPVIFIRNLSTKKRKSSIKKEQVESWVGTCQHYLFQTLYCERLSLKAQVVSVNDSMIDLTLGGSGFVTR